MKKLVCSLGVVALTAVMAISLSSVPADARPGGPGGGPLCGWTAMWECTLPNGKTKVVIGTQCDIFKFEQKTGATCEPI